jgi:hypothetical protein
MSKPLCQACQQRPTSAVLCPDCAGQLEDALAKLASWHRPPPGVVTGSLDRPARLGPRAGGRGTTTSWDSASSAVALGGTRGLALELDVAAARQSRMAGHNGPRLAPDSKVWAPSDRRDRVDHDLAGAVITWIGRLRDVDVRPPRAVASGAVLARGCTWLLWHVAAITVHPKAAEAVEAFTAVVSDLERLVDRPADQVYVGPCWHVGPEGVATWCDLDSRAEQSNECPADLYAKPGAAVAVCGTCGAGHLVAERQAWLAANVGDTLAPAVEICRALARLQLNVNPGKLRMWVSRGELAAHGTRPIGPKRSVPLYRVDEVLKLALAPKDGRGRTRRTG